MSVPVPGGGSPCPRCIDAQGTDPERIHWVITGGESGPGARPVHQNWVRSLRDQCSTAGVPFFFKQWGNWLPSDQDPNYGIGPGTVRASLAGDGKNGDVGLWTNRGKKTAGAVLDGRLWREMPAATATLAAAKTGTKGVAQ